MIGMRLIYWKIKQIEILLLLLIFFLLPKNGRGQIASDFEPSDTILSYSATPGSLLVSEVLFNPYPGGCDYVELYNSRPFAVSLQGVSLVKCNANGEMGRFYHLPASYVVNPHQYVVLTTDASDLSNHYSVRFPSHVVQLESMPSLANTEGTVLVALEDSTVIDCLHYKESFHSALLMDRKGVALERRSFDVETQQPSNWFSAASTSGYGTPTAPNSQSKEFFFLEDDIQLSSPTVSPDADGYQDVLEIHYQLVPSDTPIHCNLNIVDRQGRLVRKLLKGALLGTEGVVEWDGLDSMQKPCSRGDYLLVIEVYDLHNRHQVIRRSVAVVY